MTRQASGRPNSDVSQSHDRNFEAFSSCLSLVCRFSPAYPLLGTGSTAARKWEHDSHPHPGQLGLQRYQSVNGSAALPAGKKLNSQSRRENMPSHGSCELKFLNLILSHVLWDVLIPALALMPKQSFSKQSVYPISVSLPVEEVN